MSKKTQRAFRAAYGHFEGASNQHGDAATAINMTGAGLTVLTGIIEELYEEVVALRAK